MNKRISEENVKRIIEDVSKAYGLEGYYFSDEEIEIFRRYLNKIFEDKEIYKVISKRLY